MPHIHAIQTHQTQLTDGRALGRERVEIQALAVALIKFATVKVDSSVNIVFA